MPWKNNQAAATKPASASTSRKPPEPVEAAFLLGLLVGDHASLHVESTPQTVGNIEVISL